MLDMLKGRRGAKTTPITVLEAGDEEGYKAFLAAQTPETRKWLEATGFELQPGSGAIIPGKDGSAARAVTVVEDGNNPFSYGNLPKALEKLHKQHFHLEDAKGKNLKPKAATAAALGYALGTYAFTPYKTESPAPKFPKLAWPAGANRDEVKQGATATFLVRDLINTPAADLGPAELEQKIREQGDEFGAKVSSIVGDDLLKQNYPAVYAVGRGSEREPRLVDLKWGDEDAPKITIVGKGVCFDTGGYNLKPGNSMRNMKKDMGGSAMALGLARMIMMSGMNVRLRLLIPAVDNDTSGDAMYPGDILKTRKGKTIEVGNTDAEGRLILADALAEGASEKPDLLIDFATLTGAARVALGPDLPPFFTNDDKVAESLTKAANDTNDPLWQMPLWKPYLAYMKSQSADISNTANQPYAGAITAALFLQTFAEEADRWVHIDAFGWTPVAKPGQPVEGEAQGMRAAFNMIARRVGDLEKQKKPAPKRKKAAPGI